MEIVMCIGIRCARPADVASRKLCYKHYKRWQTYGDPNRTIKSGWDDPIEDRMRRWSRKEGDCVVFLSLSPGGYGRIRHDGKYQQAHRVSWELANGPIPDGLEIDHMCHNHACIFVPHLRLATSKQNKENQSGPQRNSKSGIRGVAWNSRANKWQAAVQHNKKKHYLGLFDDKHEAGRAAAAKRMELFTHSQN